MIVKGSLGDFRSYDRYMKQIKLSSCARVNLVVKSKIAIKILKATPFNVLLGNLKSMFTTSFCKRWPLENVHGRATANRSNLLVRRAF